MDNPKRVYYDNGNIRSEHWHKNKQSHRLNGPARIYYYENGNKKIEGWYVNGEYIKMPYDNYPLTKEQIIEMKLIYG